jgi:hypothetical protein
MDQEKSGNPVRMWKKLTGLPDFSWSNITKREEIYQMTAKYTKMI